ncbi:hypothetical protein [Mycobacterium shottsii]
MAGPMVPVAAARAARDAVAAGFTTRGKDRDDALRLARRIAAALNAPGGGADHDFGFFWITAVTVDGQISVANSYGLAFIPDRVELPDVVQMASADHAIPAGERARCATYPLLAVQAWATHHDTTLPAVIGTAEQLADCDPGVAKIILEPDDIPESGKMTGRSRLEVVNPAAAARLSDTKDPSLIKLLPPAPVAADVPADQDGMLWFEVTAPMASSAAGREAAHLRAFQPMPRTRRNSPCTWHTARPIPTPRVPPSPTGCTGNTSPGCSAAPCATRRETDREAQSTVTSGPAD